MNAPAHTKKQILFTLLSLVLIAGLLLAQAQPASAAQAGSTPGPVDPAPGKFFKAASKPALKLGETLTYTIHLETSMAIDLQVDVFDPLPAELDYVPGSASHGGVYEAATHSISWKDLLVGGGRPLELTFDVKDTTPVIRPTPVANTAYIECGGFHLQRQAWVTLMPEPTTEPPLAGSFKSAWPRLLGPGETVTYKIHLLNHGNVPLTVQVVDPVPAALAYVPDSASHGGTYDPATKTLTWKDILVPPYSPLLPVEPVTLSFAARAPNAFPDSVRPRVVTNTAAIASGSIAFKRSVDILLAPHPYSPLEGSYKAASHRSVFPGQVFTYSIVLHNRSPFPVPAQVRDPLPEQVSYVPGSANAGGVYDHDTRTLRWSGLEVPGGASLTLTFDVTAGGLTANSVRIVNTAYISTWQITLARSITILLQPGPGIDPIPPVVRRFAIDGQDVLAGREVRLHIDAVDNIGVKWMYLKEWVLVTSPYPHWLPVRSSGWVPYEPESAWKLGEQSGTHFMAVWVADAARNRSRLTHAALDFASLLQPATPIARGGLIPYLVYYPAGVEVTAELKTLSGAAGMFVWFPGSLFAPDYRTVQPAFNLQTIKFTTRSAGIYVFLVFGFQTSLFDLSITPGGGPRLPVPLPYRLASALPLEGSLLPQAEMLPEGLEPTLLLLESGLDPLGDADEPAGPYQIFVPTVID